MNARRVLRWIGVVLLFTPLAFFPAVAQDAEPAAPGAPAFNPPAPSAPSFRSQPAAAPSQAPAAAPAYAPPAPPAAAPAVAAELPVQPAAPAAAGGMPQTASGETAAVQTDAIPATGSGGLDEAAAEAAEQAEYVAELRREFNAIPGPIQGDLGSGATVQVSADQIFFTGGDAANLLAAMQNFPSRRERGMVGASDLSWFVIFEFDDVGYVKDDEKAELNASKMLKEIKKGNDAANEERERNGWETLEIIGWDQEPHYDEKTNNLVWAIRAQSEGSISVNYNTRLLGRSGVMELTLVTEPEQMGTAVAQLNSLIETFDFGSGQRYTEFQPGDRIAEYGLTALVVGGAAGLAAKSGAFKYLWKGIIVAVAAVLGIFKKFFGGSTRSA